MTNIIGNRSNKNVRCAFCGVKIRGYINWLCPAHRTPEFAEKANAKQESKERLADAVKASIHENGVGKHSFNVVAAASMI